MLQCYVKHKYFDDYDTFSAALFIEPLDGPGFFVFGRQMLFTEFTGIEY